MRADGNKTSDFTVAEFEFNSQNNHLIFNVDYTLYAVGNPPKYKQDSYCNRNLDISGTISAQIQGEYKLFEDPIPTPTPQPTPTPTPQPTATPEPTPMPSENPCSFSFRTQAEGEQCPVPLEDPYVYGPNEPICRGTYDNGNPNFVGVAFIYDFDKDGPDVTSLLVPLGGVAGLNKGDIKVTIDKVKNVNSQQDLILKENIQKSTSYRTTNYRINKLIRKDSHSAAIRIRNKFKDQNNSGKIFDSIDSFISVYRDSNANFAVDMLNDIKSNEKSSGTISTKYDSNGDAWGYVVATDLDNNSNNVVSNLKVNESAVIKYRINNNQTIKMRLFKAKEEQSTNSKGKSFKKVTWRAVCGE